MRILGPLASLLLGLAVPGGAFAHPHVFIDTALSFVFDAEGRLAEVRVDWAYDDFYTLLMIEENGLDVDGDGTPEAARLDAFAGQDVDWEAGFPGDLSIKLGGAEVPLDRPVDHAARFEDGRIVTSHTRPLTAPVDPAGETLVARAYDPTYFVAYDVPTVPVVEGRDDCNVTRDAADREAAQREYGDQLAAIDTTGDPFEEVELPDIGILFADAFRLTCGARF